MTTRADPKRTLEALLGQDPSPLEGLPPDAVDAAKALAQQPSGASASNVEALPEPLALAVLEASVRAGDASLADALGDSKQKPLAKAAKKALYQLRSRGHEVPQKKGEPAQTPAAQPEEPLPSLVSTITGTGERALIIGRPLRGRVETLQLVIADEHGVVHLGTNEISRGQYRKMLKDARRPGAPSAIEIPLEKGKALLAEAAGTNLRSRTPFPAGLDVAMRHLEVKPQEHPPQLPPVEEADQGLAVNGGSLHDQPEIAQWLPPVEALRSFAQKAQEIAVSPLYIDEKQRAEQLRATVASMAETFLTTEHRRIYGLRLWQMADFFDATDRAETAKVARAEARRIFHGAEGMLSPFTLRLFEKVLALTGPAPAAGGMPRPPGAGQQEAPEPGPGPTEKKSPGGLILP